MAVVTSARPTELVAVADGIHPVNATGALGTDYVDMSDFHALMVVVNVGTMSATGTLDGKFQQADTSAGGNVKDVTGKAITQLTAAGTDSDKFAVCNVREDDLDIDGGFRYVRWLQTTATANSYHSAVLLGFTKGAPASTYDHSEVDEVVT